MTQKILFIFCRSFSVAKITPTVAILVVGNLEEAFETAEQINW